MGSNPLPECQEHTLKNKDNVRVVVQYPGDQDEKEIVVKTIRLSETAIIQHQSNQAKTSGR